MAYPNVTKCTIAFQQLGYGWTENYFLDSATTTLQTEMDALYALAQKRILLCGEQTTIEWLKCSAEATKRDVLVKNVAAINGAPLQATNGQDSEDPDTALLMQRVDSTNQKVAPLYCRGIRDSLFVLGGRFRFLDPGWLADFGSYRGLLIATTPGWCFLAKSSSTPARQAINTILPNATQQLNFTLAGNLFQVGQVNQKVKVFVSGCQGCENVNGQLLVLVTAQNACTSVRQIPIFDYMGMGFMSNSVPAIFRISDVRQQRVVERKVGRPLYLSRGRRPNRQVG